MGLFDVPRHHPAAWALTGLRGLARGGRRGGANADADDAEKRAALRAAAAQQLKNLATSSSAAAGAAAAARAASVEGGWRVSERVRRRDGASEIDAHVFARRGEAVGEWSRKEHALLLLSCERR